MQHGKQNSNVFKFFDRYRSICCGPYDRLFHQNRHFDYIAFHSYLSEGTYHFDTIYISNTSNEWPMSHVPSSVCSRMCYNIHETYAPYRKGSVFTAIKMNTTYVSVFCRSSKVIPITHTVTDRDFRNCRNFVSSRREYT